MSAVPRSVVTGLAGLLVALGLLGALAVLGPLATTVALLGVVVGLILLADARRTVLLALGVLILVEANRSWGVEAAYAFWQPQFARTSIMDLLLYASYGATLLLVVRRRSVRLPTPFTGPLLGLGVLLLAGTAWSVLGGADVRFQLISTFQTYVPALLIPFVLVNVIDHGTDLRRVVTGGVGLGVVKALSGLIVVFAGLSAAAGNDPGLTFYEPAANLFLLAVLLTVVAALASRVPLPIWMRIAGVLAFLSLLFSFRRTFYLAGLLCIVLVLLAASGRVGRRLAIPAAFLVAGAVFLGLRSGIASDPSGALATRIESINPSKVVRNNQDRYRLTERRNVLAEIREHPLTGIGVGVQWRQQYPLNFEVVDLQYYSHTAILWHWLKYGVMGPLMYLWLIVAGALSGLRVFRGTTDRFVACAGLGAGMALVGLAVVELASTVIGPDLRGGMVAGVLLGLLAVAEQGLGGPAAAEPTDRVGGRMSDVGRSTGDGSSLESGLRVLRERWWVIVAVAVLVVAVVLAKSLTETDQYEGTATLLVQPSQATSLVNQAVNQNADPARDQATALLLVTSGEVAERVRKVLRSPRSADDLAASVKAASEPDANLITVTATDPDPAESARVANAFAEQFSAFRLESSRQQLDESARDLRLQLDRTVAENERQTITETLAEVLRLRAVTTGGVEVVNKAAVPTVRSSPTPKRDAVFALLLGVILGVGLAFVIDLLDRRVKTPEEFEHIYGFPALTTIPERSSAPSNQRERQAAMEPFRILRNGLAQLGGENGARVILVTSAVPGEGKSTVAAGLARAIALSGQSVTLVEADMRRPTFHHQFELGDDARGLTTSIVGGISASTLTRPVLPGLTTLTVLPSGPVPPNAAELLRSPQFGAVLADLLGSVDFVVLDAPPLLPVADSQVLLDHPDIDAAIIVARAFTTKRDEARRAAEVLRRRRLGSIGLVVNGLRNVGNSFDYYGAEG